MVSPNKQQRNSSRSQPGTVVQMPGTQSAPRAKTWPSPSEPMKVARKFVAQFAGKNPLRFIDGEWLGYNKRGFWNSLPDRAIRDQLYKSLEHAVFYQGQDLQDWNPNNRKINDVIDALKTVAANDQRPNLFGWFNGRTDQVIPCANGLLDIQTRTLEPLTPDYFNRYVLTCKYNPAAASAAWGRYKHENLGDDRETIESLEEWGGYTLSGSKSLERFLLMIGQSRSGKGTYVQVLNGFLPPEAHIGFKATDYLRDKFSDSNMIGKTLITVSDSRSKLDDVRFVDLILRLVGNDEFSIRKPYGRDYFNGVLPGRLVILSNKVPVLADDSQAILGRALVIKMNKSYVNKEDPELIRSLVSPESLSGILNNFLDGLDRLRVRGKFFQPSDGDDIKSLLRENSSPVRHFISECCKIEQNRDLWETKQSLYQRYAAFCSQYGYRAEDYSRFATALYAATDQTVVGAKRNSADGSRQVAVFAGIRLLDRADGDGKVLVDTGYPP